MEKETGLWRQTSHAACRISKYPKIGGLFAQKKYIMLALDMYILSSIESGDLVCFLKAFRCTFDDVAIPSPY